MTIIQSTKDFDIRLLFNAPLLFLLSLVNPQYKIYRPEPNPISLQSNYNPLGSLNTHDHDTAIRAQYFLGYRLLSICFACFIVNYFGINPLLLFYIRFAWSDHEYINSLRASLIFVFLYGSCILGVVLWMVLARCRIWNLGVFAQIEIEAEQDDAEPIDEATRRKMDHFRRHSHEARLNGFVLCLRWLLFGYAISLLLMGVSSSYTHSLLAAGLMGVFYPNLLIVSAGVMIYSIDQLTSVKRAQKFMAGMVGLGWIILPITTGLAGEGNWWAPFVMFGFALSVCILYIMCFGPRKTTKLEIGDMADELVSVEDDKGDTRDADDDDENREDAVLLTTKDRSDSMIFPGAVTAEDQYTEIGGASASRGSCDRSCRYHSDIMSRSMGMFQLSTFLLNIESFLTNICLSIYFCWYCTVMETDFEQSFITSTGQMSVSGVVVVGSVLAVFRWTPSVYYYYLFRVMTNLSCTALCVVMVHLYDVTILYWFVLPVAMAMMVLLDVSTHLILAANTPNGCIAFIFGSNQIFQLTAFVVGPLLMGLFCDFEADDNSQTYWSITSAILGLQLLITVFISVLQSMVLCCCPKEDEEKQAQSDDPTDMET